MLSSKQRAVALAAAMVGVLVAGLAPSAGAQTAYEMFGYGDLVATVGPGLTACPPACDQNTHTVYTFETLPITGVGMLLGQEVAANYNCPSDVTVDGNTSNFKLLWDFTCTKTEVALVGPDVITGSFTNSANPGAPIFSGVFRVEGAGEVASTCSGVPIPTSYDFEQNTIPTLFFAGECTSVG